MIGAAAMRMIGQGLRHVALLGVIGLAAGCMPAGSRAADWPHWRGPDRNDITPEASGWSEGAWPLGEPAWTRSVGHGGTSPIVVQDRLYTMGWEKDSDHVWCLEAGTGQEIWRQRYPCPKYGRYHKGDENWYHGPSSTPAYDLDTGFLYTLSIDGDLNCWYARGDGGRFWTINLYDEYGVGRRPDVPGGLRDYGYTTSPLIYGDWVIVEVGDDEGSLMAFDKSTGRRQWTSECNDPAGHTGGLVPLTVEGLPCVAVLTLHRLLVVRLDAGHEGETLATYDWQTSTANNIATPAVAADCVVLSSGYNMSKTARLRIASNGVSKLWEARYFSKVCSPVIYNGHVYIAWQKLRCLDYATGELRWEGGAFGDDGSCLVTGDGRLIVFGNRRVALVETADRSPGFYAELWVRNKVGSSPCWPHVVLAGGRLYVKDSAGSLFCFPLGG
jgi:outer membrane protein assembly factor BamB